MALGACPRRTRRTGGGPGSSVPPDGARAGSLAAHGGQSFLPFRHALREDRDDVVRCLVRGVHDEVEVGRVPDVDPVYLNVAGPLGPLPLPDLLLRVLHGLPLPPRDPLRADLEGGVDEDLETGDPVLLQEPRLEASIDDDVLPRLLRLPDPPDHLRVEVPVHVRVLFRVPPEFLEGHPEVLRALPEQGARGDHLEPVGLRETLRDRRLPAPGRAANRDDHRGPRPRTRPRRQVPRHRLRAPPPVPLGIPPRALPRAGPRRPHPPGSRWTLPREA